MTRLTLPNPPKIKATNFRPQRVQAFNPLRSGNHQAVDMGEPLWLCDIETTDLSRSQSGDWKWLLAKLRGAIRTLMLWDVSRPRPLAYHDTTDTPSRIGVSRRIGGGRRIGSKTRAWGSPTIVEIDRENSRVHLANLVPNAVILSGDYGAWDDGPTRRLFILGEATADAHGNAWVEVEFAPPSTSENLPAGFEMYRASAEFVVLQASAPYSAPVVHQVTLQAVQVLRRS